MPQVSQKASDHRTIFKDGIPEHSVDKTASCPRCLAAAADKPNGSEGESSNGAFHRIDTPEMSGCDVADDVTFQLIYIVLLLLINKPVLQYRLCRLIIHILTDLHHSSEFARAVSCV